MSSPLDNTAPARLTRGSPVPGSGRDALPALRRAAEGSRTPFTTLFGIAVAESNLAANASNKRSSATGPFQITERTWLELVKRYGGTVGRSDLAGLVTTNADGTPGVAPENRSKLMDARRDVELSAKLTAKLCDENRRGLARTLGRPPSESEVRLAHFLGLGGATKLIQAARETPDISVRELLPRAFAHNRGTLSDNGKPMTAAQAVVVLDSRYARELASPARDPEGAPKPPSRPAGPSPVLVAQLATITLAAAPPAPDPVVVDKAETDTAPKALACEGTAAGIRCAL